MSKSKVILCPICLHKIENAAQICPYCEQDLDNLPEIPQALPLRHDLRRKYHIVYAVKRGGFSIVYTAFHRKKNTPVAIKEYFPENLAIRATDGLQVLHKKKDWEEYEQGLDNFLEEARLMQHLRRSSGIVPLLDFFHANGTSYIVMPLLIGWDISEELAMQGSIPFATALKMLLPVMEVVQNMHDKGFVHADISPSNIFLQDTGKVKLLDLGSMCRIGKHTHTFDVKPGYTAPEMYHLEQEILPAADVYSLSATLYRMTTSLVPQDARDREKLDALAPPSHLGINMPKRAEKAIMRGMALHSEFRYENMADFMDAILPPPIKG